jgi:endonuclease/exonuclease/phosphatase family metal-dependent hydrolase
MSEKTPCSDTMQDDLFHVVCYNVNQCLSKARHFANIVALLQKQPMCTAHAIILQEVMVWDEVQQLADALHMHCSKDAWVPGGHTVITKCNILNTWAQINEQNDWHNGVAGVLIQPGGQSDGAAPKLWILSVHLDDRKYKRDETQRLQEINWILRHLPATPLSPARVGYILAGDFNSPNHGDNMGLVNKTVYPSHMMEAMGWRDVQRGQSWTRSTWMQSKSKYGVDRIDCIYIKGPCLVGMSGAIIDHHDLGLAHWPTGKDHRLLFHSFRIMSQMDKL